MEAMEAMLTRKSVKKFKSDAVERATIEKIVEAGISAASGMNMQSPIVLAVTDKAMRDKLSALNAQVAGMPGDPFYGAPVVLVVLAKKDVITHVYDGSLVMGNMLLAAHATGLGACWIHRAKEVFETPEGQEILRGLGIEEEYEGIGNCIVGYSEAEGSVKPRKENRVYYI